MARAARCVRGSSFAGTEAHVTPCAHLGVGLIYEPVQARQLVGFGGSIMRGRTPAAAA
jgi:hypothetical protein